MTMSPRKPTRTFVICTGPVVVPSGPDAYDIVKPPMRHTVKGCELKFIVGPDFFQVIDQQGTPVFTTPINSVLWCTTTQAEPTLYCVDEDEDPA